MSKGFFGKGCLVSECPLHETDVEMFFEAESLLYRREGCLSS